MKYDAVSGDVSLVIVQIGPGDEGEYTCNATNQYGEAICSIRIQPEGKQIMKFIIKQLYVIICHFIKKFRERRMCNILR